jgi:hypothetical protein
MTTLTRDSLQLPLCLSRLFVLAWSLLRVATSVVRGLDGEGVLAAAIVVVVALSFRSREI